MNCQSCVYKEKDINFGIICKHKASIEGIEAEKEFYKISEITDCSLYEYDETSALDR